MLFWTTCLLTSCATSAARPEDANYIARETVSPQRPLGACEQTAPVASSFSAEEHATAFPATYSALGS